MISVVIVAYNEDKKLKKCLSSVRDFADEIVVIDLGSTDNTVRIAEQFSSKIYSHTFVPYVELIRNYAISKCSGDWVLILDPDEYLKNPLKKYLLRITSSNRPTVLNIPRKNIFFGQWIKFTNFWPDYQIRFFKKGTVKWKKILHSYPDTTIPFVQLPKHQRYAIQHVTYPSFRSFISKQKRYAAVRAQERYKAGEKASLSILFYCLIREFLSRYIKHKGFFDKKRGLMLMIGLFYYFCAVEWNLLQLYFKNNIFISNKQSVF